MDNLILKEIEQARQLYARHGRVLTTDIKELLEKYRFAINSTQRAMRDLGIQSACRVCSAEMGESCCFDGVEEQYDRILLLVNLLMGVEIPGEHEVAGYCFFVGREGCKLTARPYFCINYLCPALSESLESARIGEFRCTAGVEIAAGWEVELAVREVIRREKLKNNP